MTGDKKKDYLIENPSGAHSDKLTDTSISAPRKKEMREWHYRFECNLYVNDSI